MLKKEISSASLFKKVKALSAVCFLSLGLVVLSSNNAYAACSSPVGATGDQVYNSTHSVMQYCDGTDWTAMRGDDLGAGGTTAGTLYTSNGSVGRDAGDRTVYIDNTRHDLYINGNRAYRFYAGSIRPETTNAKDVGANTVRWRRGYFEGTVSSNTAPTLGDHLTNKTYVDAQVSAGGDNLGNHISTQDLVMATFKITGLGDPTAAQDAATKTYVDTAIAAGGDNLGNHTMTQRLVTASNWINGDTTANEGIQIDVNGEIVNNRAGATYDIWLQGGLQSDTGQARNLALLGDEASDLLYVNYGSEYASGTIIGGLVKIYNGADASLADGSGYLVLGGEAAANMVLDDNEIQGRNNNAVATIFLNAEGGNVHIGKDGVASGNLDMNEGRIYDLPVPSGANDAATKGYVDGLIAGTGDDLGNHTATQDLTVGGILMSFTDSVTTAPDFDLNGSGILAAETHLYINIDSDNTSTGAGLIVKKDAKTSAGANIFQITENGKVGAGIGADQDGTVTITGGTDISAVNTAGQGNIVIQDSAANTTGRKLRIDANEIQASNNNAAVALMLNPFGGNIAIGTDGTATGNIDMNEGRIYDLPTPVGGSDAATKTYVDGLVAAVPGDNLGSGGTTTGTLYSKNATGFGYFGTSGSNFLRFDETPASSNGRAYMRLDGTYEYQFRPTYFAPYATNLNDFGASSIRWKNGYFAGTVDATAAPTAGTHLTNKTYVDGLVAAVPGDDLGNHTMTQRLVTADNWINGDTTANEGIQVNTAGEVVMQRTGATYDIWLQGGLQSDTGQARNLALLGNEASDVLYVNYGSEYASGTIIGGLAKIYNGADASLADGSGYLVLGTEGATNMVLDDNEIQGRNNNAAATIYLNQEGGNVHIGKDGVASGNLDMNEGRIYDLPVPSGANDAATKGYVDGLIAGTGDDLGNHTATANINIGANILDYNNSTGDKVLWYSNTYGTGIESSTLTNWAQANHRWRIGGTSVSTGTQGMLLNSSGLNVTGYTLTSGQSAVGSTDRDGTLTITGFSDVNALNTAGQGALVIQSSAANTTGYKLRMDANEIQASNNNAATALNLNPFGGNINIGADGTATGNIDMNEGRIYDLPTPVGGSDAATKGYVDGLIAGTGDDLGNHTATANLNMATHWLGDGNAGGLNFPSTDGRVRIDTTSATYDLWIQGGAASSGATRNLAFLGNDEDSGDYLRINVGGEYSGGTRIEGKTSIGTSDIDGRLTVTGGSDISAVNTAGQGNIVIQDSAANTTGRKLRIDANEIQASNANAAASLTLNPFGGNINIGADGTATGNIDMNEGRIYDLPTPVGGSDAATKTYVDGLVAAVPGDNLGSGGTTTGAIYSQGGTGYGYFGSSASNRFRFDDAAVGNEAYLYLNGAFEYHFSTTNFQPYVNNANDLGGTSNKWKNGYFAGVLDASGGITTDGKTIVHGTQGQYHGAHWPNDTRYGYYAGYNNTGTRGYYFGYGNGSTEVDIVLDAANRLNIKSGVLDMNNNKITDLGTPTAAADAATKAYVDAEILSGGDDLGAGGSGDLITDNTIDSSEIQNNTLTADDLAANSVTASEIAADAVGASELANNAVASANIVDNSITGADILNNTLTASDIGPNAVAGSEITNGSVVATTELSATGTKNSTTFLRGDNTWAVAGGDDLGNHNATTRLDMNANKIIDVGGSDASLSDGSGYMVLGLETSSNIVMDNNELQARNNNVGSTLYINGEGGSVTIGKNNNAVVANLDMNEGNITDLTNITATAFFHSSDERLKENIKTTSGLDLITQLRGVEYNWKDSGNASAGVIAQEVEKVFPRAVTTDEEGMLAVEYDQLIGPLIEAVKELKAQNDAMRLEIDALKGKE